MKRLGVTQEDLGRALSRDRTVAGRIINGEQPLKLDEVLPLADALKMSPFEVLFRAGMWANREPKGASDRQELIGIYEQLPPAKRGDFLETVRLLVRLTSGAGVPPEAPAARSSKKGTNHPDSAQTQAKPRAVKGRRTGTVG